MEEMNSLDRGWSTKMIEVDQEANEDCEDEEESKDSIIDVV